LGRCRKARVGASPLPLRSGRTAVTLLFKCPFFNQHLAFPHTLAGTIQNCDTSYIQCRSTGISAATIPFKFKLLEMSCWKCHSLCALFTSRTGVGCMEEGRKKQQVLSVQTMLTGHKQTHSPQASGPGKSSLSRSLLLSGRTGSESSQLNPAEANQLSSAQLSSNSSRPLEAPNYTVGLVILETVSTSAGPKTCAADRL
jgi:hypothetical protein